MKNKNILRPVIATAIVLSVPFVAMQFTAEVQWDLFDFIVMGALVFGTGLAYEFALLKGGERAYRFAVGLALAGAFLLVWMNGAVGLIGNENNPANLLYCGVLAIGFFGALIARLEAVKMARVLVATAIAQALVPVVAFIIWKPDFSSGVVQVFFLNGLFVALFLASAWLFQRAGSRG